MKVIKTLSTTTLTGNLLFTGIGVANSNEVHAAEIIGLQKVKAIIMKLLKLINQM